MKARLRILHAAQLVAVTTRGQLFLRGAEQNTVEVILDGGVVVGNDGNILFVGSSAEVETQSAGYTFDEDIDATGRCVLPGFVDAHSHPVWSGDRCHEFKLKLAGATYMEVQKAGGGIAFTVRHTAASTEEELGVLLRQRLDRMLRCGTTTAEAKSGYGLEKDTELKMLRVIHQAKGRHPIDLVSTFLGAHAVPAGMTSEQATAAVLEMIPVVVAERDAGLNDVENIDVFCETGVFSCDESRRILAAGAAAGMEINFHGDELSALQSGELAGELSALAVSHLEHVSPEGIAAMARRPTFAVLLPTTVYVLRIAPPPTRAFIDGGVPVALGSDFCPNAHCLSMPMTMNLACVLMRMTCNEALVAATINAAASIKRSHVCGSIEVGKWGDLVLLDAPLWEHVIYEMGDAPVTAVFKKGCCVWRAPHSS